MKFCLAAAVFALIAGCASMYQGYTSSSLVNTSGEERRYEPVGEKAFGAETEHLRVTYVPDVADSGVAFQFENKSGKAVRIIWDETTFIGPDGESERVLHAGVLLKDRNQSQPPTVVPPMAKVTDQLIPTSRVEWEEGGTYTAGGWKYAPLCGTKNMFTHRLQDDTCLGKAFGFFITYEVDGKKKNMTLRYKYLAKNKTETNRATAGK